MASEYWLGVDLGGTKILAGLFADSARPLVRAKEPTPFDEGAEEVVDSAVAAVERIIEEANIDRSAICGMGFSVPGQVDYRRGWVTNAPNLGWRNVDLSALLPKEWTWPIVVENDVRVGTFGEWKFGAAQGAQHVLGVFAGTGVGGGLVLDGKLYHGFNLHAGEIGHIIVNWRKGTTLEDIAGRRNVVRRGEELLDDAPKLVRKAWRNVDLGSVRSSLLADFYERDDPIAVQIIDDAAKAIAAGIASCLNLLSPEVIVLGGGLAVALGDSFRERIWELAIRWALPGAGRNVRFVPAALGDDAGIVGAAAYAESMVQDAAS